MFRSATFKLTLWYICLVMAISLVFSAVVYHLAINEIAHGINLQSERIYNKFPVFDHNPTLMRPGSDIATDDHALLLRLVFFNLVVLILAGMASYWLAKRTLEPIEEAHEQQKRFTADVSHELRTPLTALRMESEVALLSSDTSKSDLRKTIESNLEEVSKLEKLINNLLRLSRLDADELRQNFQAIKAQKIAQKAIDQLDSVAKERNIIIQSSLSSQTIYGDSEAVTQLLVIILDNALKYSSSGQTIEFELKDSKERAGSVIFSIQDHGVGIDKQALDRIFDRFYRADASRTKDKSSEGYGLGLSIAKMIADVHNAAITVTSQLGKGTSVDIEFPPKPSS
jgi:two-component system, OmpR family, sensor histidine kinase CiaH